jgi:hypothetical protein
MFVRRDRRSGARFLAWRVALFATAAVVWLVGLVAEQSLVTGAAILILLAAVALGVLARSD